MDRWIEVVREALALKVKFHQHAPPNSNEQRQLDDATHALELAQHMRLESMNTECGYMGETNTRMEFSAYNAHNAAFFGGRRNRITENCYVPY